MALPGAAPASPVGQVQTQDNYGHPIWPNSAGPANLTAGPGGGSSFPAAPGSPFGTGVYPGAAGAQPYEANFPGGTPSSTPRPADSPLSNAPTPPRPKGALSTGAPSGSPPAGRRVPGAPDLGYYQPNKRFGTIQYQTPNSVGARAPIYTALNLGGR